MGGFYVWVAGAKLQQHDIWWGVTPDPAIEATMLPPGAKLSIITPPVPLWIAEVVTQRVCHRRHMRPQPRWSIARNWLARAKAQAALTSLGWDHRQVPRAIVGQVTATRIGDTGFSEAALRSLATRQLLEDEVQQSLSEQGIAQRCSIRTEMHRLVLAGLVVRESAVGLGQYDRWRCRRCGSERVDLVWCARCGGECPQCRDCRNLGQARGCAPLYHLTQAGLARIAPSEPMREIEVKLPFVLSPAQKAAADKITNAVQEGVRQILVWAACGAGKTEVVYDAIQKTLAQAGRVLLATPRRDVTAELCERLKAVFGEKIVAGLYGGAERHFTDAPVLVATTHQAVRLNGTFHLVILDECDAFPLSTEPILQRAIARLTAGTGCFVQMSATPSAELRSRSDMRLVHIPARHHGYPLPVPTVELDRGVLPWKTKGSLMPHECPSALARALVETRRQQAQLLVFVPTRSLVSPLVSAIRTVGVTDVAGVHSGSHERDAVRAAFAAGAIETVVATTVFERGLTFPRVNVVVFAADTARIFDAAALIQMAGRVGRTKDRPTGNVWFICARKTAEIERAIADIMELNNVAAQMGLLCTGR